jgi:hypothetical protein
VQNVFIWKSGCLHDRLLAWQASCIWWVGVDITKWSNPATLPPRNLRYKFTEHWWHRCYWSQEQRRHRDPDVTATVSVAVVLALVLLTFQCPVILGSLVCTGLVLSDKKCYVFQHLYQNCTPLPPPPLSLTHHTFSSRSFQTIIRHCENQPSC